MKPRLEAMHLVALRIDAIKKRGEAGQAKAEAMADAAAEQWKKQFRDRNKCPHCGKRIR